MICLCLGGNEPSDSIMPLSQLVSSVALFHGTAPPTFKNKVSIITIIVNSLEYIISFVDMITIKQFDILNNKSGESR